MQLIASLLSVIGLSAAIYLSRLYYSIHAGTASFASFCNINERMNCDAVASSKFAELVPGLPLSSVVAGWFATLLLVSLISGVNEWRKEANAFGLVMSAIGSLYSIVLLWVMFGVLKTGCLFCLIIDGANFALFAYFLWRSPRPFFSGLNWKRLQNFAILGIVLTFVSVLLLRPMKPRSETFSNDDLAQIVERTVAQKPVTFDIPPGTTTFGNPNAKITVVEFSDFQCPYCKRGAVLLNTLLHRYPEDLKVVFINFPLDQACHWQIKQPMHPYSCELARGGLCADRLGKFLPFYEETFEDQENLTQKSATEGLKKLGLSDADAALCLQNEEHKKTVAAQIALGITANVQSTPTFFANGYRIEGVLPLEAWDQLIERLKK